MPKDLTDVFLVKNHVSSSGYLRSVVLDLICTAVPQVQISLALARVAELKDTCDNHGNLAGERAKVPLSPLLFLLSLTLLEG